MNKYLSVKLKVISFFLMVMVVYLHSSYLVIKLNSGNIELHRGYNSFIQDFFSQGITRIAVPLFFLISGYLFYFNIRGSLREFVLKFKKRLKTLVVPYLFWSIWGLLFYFILQSIPMVNSFFTNKLIKDYSIMELLSTIFLNPIPYQLWFIKDLILLIVISPIIFWLIKYIRNFTILIFIFAWFFDFDFIFFSNQSLFFFLVGAFLCNNKTQIMQIGFLKNAWIYCCFWIMIVFCKTALVYVEFQNLYVINIIGKIGILIGIISIWGGYDILFKNKDLTNHKFFTIFSFSFFLFAFHEPILTMLKKAFFYILGKGDFVSLMVYLVAPLFTIIVSIVTGYYLRRITPKFYDIITGGR